MNAYEFSFKKQTPQYEKYHIPTFKRKSRSTVKLSNSRAVTKLGIKDLINEFNE